MTVFVRLLSERDKDQALLECCQTLRTEGNSKEVFRVEPNSFRSIPGAPFAYWVSEEIRRKFESLSPFAKDQRCAKVGLQTADDFRFVRAWWEIKGNDWLSFAKGGPLSPFYADLSLSINWKNQGNEFTCVKGAVLRNTDYWRVPGLTYSDRTSSRFAPYIMPSNTITSVKGSGIYDRSIENVMFLNAMLNSKAFSGLIDLLVGTDAIARSYQVGTISRVPMPVDFCEPAAQLARRAWSFKRILDSISETSHAFLLPAALRARLGDYDPPAIEAELADIQAEIDDIAFDLYGFSDADRAAALGSSGAADEDDGVEDASDSEDDDSAEAVDQTDGLLSWAAGVAFGRFDWRLATGEREAPPEPDPFDPLPAKSPGMLPDDAEPFYAHSGILVDDQGHPNDLARLIEEVLARVEAPVPADVRRWLQRDFFPLHLKQYSKSRRKAPIYWPISTSSGSYTLWLYYPSLTDQTLFTAVNDFIEPKLKQVGQDVAALRTKGSARSRDDEKNFEALQALELELIELRDTLLAIAQTYRPNHDDGVQITAAPLWQLFRHKPWQKILKDTWAKLEKGDYDWAHLAMAYWPDRVREKCEADKSLAIAHDLEHFYVEPEPKPKKARGRKKDG